MSNSHATGSAQTHTRHYCHTGSLAATRCCCCCRVPLTGLASDPKVDYRQLLVDAKTARLYSWGDNVLKLAGTSAPCFLYPQEVYVHAIERKDEDGVSGAALSAEPNLGLRHLPARCPSWLPC